MAGTHLLNLRVLASEDIDNYSLLSFEGTEAISESFDYTLNIIPGSLPEKLSSWVGKLVEWDVTLSNGDERVFAGRIYASRVSVDQNEVRTIELRVRPAFWAMAYGRALHFIQDRSSIDVFKGMTADVPGLATSVDLSPQPAKRAYATRYDETEIEFLDRLLAQDGIMYFFLYDKGAGAFRHKMQIANSPQAYTDVPFDLPVLLQPARSPGVISSLSRGFRAHPAKHTYYAVEINKLDNPFSAEKQVSEDWGQVYSHSYNDLTGQAMAVGDLSARADANTESYSQFAERIDGTGDNPAFFASGRINVSWEDGGLSTKMVLTSVTHSAYDPWMLGQQGGAHYSNVYSMIDASKTYRPAVPITRKRAPGPVLGLIDDGENAEGKVVIDNQSRVPVRIIGNRQYDDESVFKPFIWLPVNQQWAHATHGAQFFPRMGTRVIVDFLYGDPDLPFVSGTMFTPSQKYPFDPAANATQSGWKSVTDKNGSITQNFLFEDKPGAEEIQLYTGRDYRRLIDNDDWGTIHHDQTLIVDNDQTETIKHDQKLNVQNDQTIKITNNRTIEVTGEEKATIQKTRTTTVTQKSLHESKQEIELKVGPCSIQLTMSGITIKAPQITIKADATLQMSGGAMAELKSPMTTVSGDGMLTLKGGMVMIN